MLFFISSFFFFTFFFLFLLWIMTKVTNIGLSSIFFFSCISFSFNNFFLLLYFTFYLRIFFSRLVKTNGQANRARAKTILNIDKLDWTNKCVVSNLRCASISILHHKIQFLDSLFSHNVTHEFQFPFITAQ